jgi:hypothetical protein
MDRAVAILNHLLLAFNIPDLVKKDESQENLFKRVNQHLKGKATSRFGSEAQRWYYLYVPDDRDE